MPEENIFDDPEMVESFLTEADEIVEQLDDDLVTLESQPDNLELLGAIFRGVHTLKGMAGFLGFTTFVQLSHETESVLDQLRKQTLRVTTSLMDVILEAIDLLKDLLEEVRAQNVQTHDLSEIIAKLGSAMRPSPAPHTDDDAESTAEIAQEPASSQAILENNSVETPADAATDLSRVIAWLTAQPASSNTNDTEDVVFETRDVAFETSEPSHENITAHAVRESLGLTQETEPDPEHIIENAVITEVSRTEFGDISKVQTEGAFRQARIDRMLDGSKPTFDESETDIASAVEDGIAITEIAFDDFEAVSVAKPTPKPTTTAKAEPEAEKAPSRPAAQPTVRAERPSGGRAEAATTTIRVDVKRLEEMMNLIGELVLERNRLLKLNRDFEQKVNLAAFGSELSENSARLNRLTTDLQRSILSVRMLPIGNVFKKFPRIVRDTARELNKEVELILSGEETELDKTIVDVIGDPLVHLIRNSIGHGIEFPQERESKGKPRTGRIWLSASHAGNEIIIEIVDDGKGIDPKVIGQKAVEKQIVTQEQLAEMSQKDILNLIFLPGFSTAKQVSQVSGRGVGLDVVRTTLKNFNGTVELDSQVGKGSRIALKLPLTLAIIQGLIVKAGRETFAIPLSSVIETVRVTPSEIQRVKGREVLDLRNHVLSLVRLKNVLTCASAEDTDRRHADTSYVVVIGVAESRIGVIVDRLVGEEEIVVKSLGSYLGDVPGIAGATIMGDGNPALILEVSAFLNTYRGAR